MVGIVAFRFFMRTILNIEPYSPLKPTMVSFIFTGPNSLSRVEVAFEELQLKLKFLYRGLRKGYDDNATDLP